MQRLLKHGNVGMVRFPQCMFGLQVDGMPIYKNTEFWSNAIELLEPFADIMCNHDQTEHFQLIGSYKGKQTTKYAQVFPPQLCKTIVEGIIRLIKNLRNEVVHFSFPSIEGRGRGRPRKYLLGIVFNCPACQNMKPKEDTGHTRRQEPPGICRYTDEDAGDFTCPACVGNKSADHPDHTRDDNCRQPLARISGLRRRRGPIRDPAIRAAGTAAGRNRPTDEDFDRGPAGDEGAAGSTDAVRGADSLAEELYNPGDDARVDRDPAEESESGRLHNDNDDVTREERAEAPPHEDEDLEEGAAPLEASTARERRIASKIQKEPKRRRGPDRWSCSGRLARF